MEFHVVWFIEASSSIYVRIRRSVYTCIYVLLCFEVCVFYLAVLIIISASILYPYIPPTHTHMHTHTQLVVISCFYLSRYDGAEGEQAVVHMSAPILTHISTFTGNIEVCITAEDLPNDDPRSIYC